MSAQHTCVCFALRKGKLKRTTSQRDIWIFFLKINIGYRDFPFFVDCKTKCSFTSVKCPLIQSYVIKYKTFGMSTVERK